MKIKKILIILVGVIVSFIVGYNSYASDCCCNVLSAPTANGTVARDTQYKSGPTNDNECYLSCFDEYRNRKITLNATAFTYKLKELPAGKQTVDGCKEQYTGGEQGTMVDIDTFVGCIFNNNIFTVTGDYLRVEAPKTGSWKMGSAVLYESQTSFTDFVYSSFSQITTDFTDYAAALVDNCAFSKVGSSPTVGKCKGQNINVVKYWSTMYYEDPNDQNTDSFCKNIWATRPQDFKQYPSGGDNVRVKSGTAEVGQIDLFYQPGGAAVTSTPLTAESTFGTGATFTWTTSNANLVAIDGATTGASINIKQKDYGTATITVTSSYGGVAKVSVLVKSMVSELEQIKSTCMKLAGDNNLFQTQCNGIATGKTQAEAIAICKDVGKTAGKEDQAADCDKVTKVVTTTTPGGTGTEKTDSELLKAIKNELTKYQPAGIINPSMRLSEIVGNSIQVALGIIGSLTFALFVYAGFKYMFSGGEQKEVQAAKNIILWAILGLAAIFGSYAVLHFVISKL